MEGSQQLQLLSFPVVSLGWILWASPSTRMVENDAGHDIWENACHYGNTAVRDRLPFWWPVLTASSHFFFSLRGPFSGAQFEHTFDLIVFFWECQYNG